MTSYKHKDTETQREFENIYRRLEMIEKGRLEIIEKAEASLDEAVKQLQQTINEVLNGNA